MADHYDDPVLNNEVIPEELMSCVPTWGATVGRMVGQMSPYPYYTECTSVRFVNERFMYVTSVSPRRIVEHIPLLPDEPLPSFTNPTAVSQAVAVIESVLGNKHSSIFIIPMVKTFVNGLKRRFADTLLVTILMDFWNWIGRTVISLITKPKA